MFDDQTSHCLFCNEILLSYPFLMSRNFETQGCQWYGVKRIKSITNNVLRKLKIISYRQYSESYRHNQNFD